MSFLPPGPTEQQRNSLDKSAQCGEPSYVWRAGQQRRLAMILDAAGERIKGRVLENGCGVGQYVDHLASYAGQIVGLEIEYDRALQAVQNAPEDRKNQIICAAGELLPFLETSFDFILSHEVLEHVADDRLAAAEMVRALKSRWKDSIICPKSRVSI